MKRMLIFKWSKLGRVVIVVMLAIVARAARAAATPVITRVEAPSTRVQAATGETPTTAVEVDVCL
jgi:hypothetical protein